MSALPRPDEGEYADYYQSYMALVPDGEILSTLERQIVETLSVLGGVSEDRETFRYADGKWSLREVVGHLMDTERVFAFRALSMARTENVDLPGMDPDEWASGSDAHERPLEALCAEWAALRSANIHMFAAMDEMTGRRSGRASGYEFTVRSFPWVIAGHELWHRKLIEREYLGAP